MHQRVISIVQKAINLSFITSVELR